MEAGSGTSVVNTTLAMLEEANVTYHQDGVTTPLYQYLFNTTHDRGDFITNSTETFLGTSLSVGEVLFGRLLYNTTLGTGEGGSSTKDTTAAAAATAGGGGSGVDESGQPDLPALVYVIAVLLFYAGVLMALLGLQLRRRTLFDPSEDDHYTMLLDRDELARRDTLLRHKLNVLKIRGLRDGHLLDLIPEHQV